MVNNMQSGKEVGGLLEFQLILQTVIANSIASLIVSMNWISYNLLIDELSAWNFPPFTGDTPPLYYYSLDGLFLAAAGGWVICCITTRCMDGWVDVWWPTEKYRIDVTTQCQKCFLKSFLFPSREATLATFSPTTRHDDPKTKRALSVRWHWLSEFVTCVICHSFV